MSSSRPAALRSLVHATLIRMPTATHRKRQQLLHPELTMTGMDNVLEKLREFEAASRAGSVSTRSEPRVTKSPGADASGSLTKKEQLIHEQGLVSVLKQIHDDLDAAVFAAYGWPGTLTDEEILERLVALNHERAPKKPPGKSASCDPSSRTRKDRRRHSRR